MVSKHTALGMKRFTPRLCHFQIYVLLGPNVHLIDLNLLIQKNGVGHTHFKGLS